MPTYNPPQFDTFLDALMVTDFDAADTAAIQSSWASLQSLTSPVTSSSIVTVGEAYAKTGQFTSLYGSFISVGNSTGFLNAISENLTGVSIASVPGELQAYQAYINQLEASGLTTQQSYGVAAANFAAAILGVVPSSLKSAASIPGFMEQQNTAFNRTAVSTAYVAASAVDPGFAGPPGTPAFVASQTVLIGVTSDGATVTNAKSQINAAASTTPPTLSDITCPSPPLSLTPGIDTFTAAVAGATFTALPVVTSLGIGVKTLNTGDTRWPSRRAPSLLALILPLLRV